jgi:hypothetical protein
VVFCSVSRFRPPTSQFQLPISLVLACRDIQVIARIRCTAISLGNRTTQPNSPMCIPREYARETRRLDIESICADLGLAENVVLLNPLTYHHVLYYSCYFRAYPVFRRITNDRTPLGERLMFAKLLLLNDLFHGRPAGRWKPPTHKGRSWWQIHQQMLPPLC